MMLKRNAGGVLLLVGILFASMAVSGRAAQGQAVTAVPKLDLNRYMGVWYEVAMYPNNPQKKCVRDATALYALSDKPDRFQLVNACRMKAGNMDAWNASGRSIDKSGSGRFKLIYIWPFSSKYWILAVGDEYDWALVGAPNHKSLWVLSRKKTIEPGLLAEIEAKATAQGFDTTKLVAMPQGR